MATLTEPNVRTCACGKTFRMRLNVRTKRFNPISTYEVPTGNIAINDDGSYRLIGKGEDYTGPRYVSHFSDCPLADRFGKRARS